MSAKNINNSSLDYHQDTTAELFESWFKNSLLVNIPKNSIIVMDNVTYHSCLLNKVPNATNTKAEIQEYMIANDIYFEYSYKKRAFNIKNEYVCYRMAEEMGHTVLRLPPYYCIFNPIEHLWHQVKSRVRSENISPTLGSTVVDLVKK
ncbi:hypothetical protein NQ315_007973 [Exocentrus adspersus]|uniref:Tc1-like transposase DDE domain-containing protein n=1 Tax=Exocentrus adspersus TaxID=1586481 RepID=A0AAV8VET3_9CUCU|nr:hypothetical protein NQ315_007973 [Exocentrus adspersus]